MLLSLFLKEKIKACLPEDAKGIDFQVSLQENPQFGDYSTNAALVLAKILKKKPRDVGTELLKRMEADQSLTPFIEKIELAGAGFLNFYLKNDFVVKELKKMYERGYEYENFGQGKRLQLEFVSANPTGPLTLANGRAGFFGDVLARVLQISGFAVEKEYYVNDAGNQIEKLGTSVAVSAGAYKILTSGEELYQGDYIRELAGEFGEYKYLMSSPNTHEELGYKIVEKNLLESIKGSLEKMGIKFDCFTSEKNDIRAKQFPERFLKLAKQRNLAYEQDGAVWLKTTEFGDDKDRVLITSDKQLTYLAADAGHYLETVERGFQGKMNILGADHHGYIGRIQAVAKIVGLKQSEIIIMQLVKLMKDGKESRMSKRKGTYVTIDEVVEELGADVTRYFFLTRAPSSQLIIELDLAKKESKENPVFYIQYAGARIASLRSKVAEYQSSFVESGSLEIDGDELALIKPVLHLPEHVSRACTERLVHLLAEYAYRLADSFHTYYEHYRVMEGEKIHQKRLFVVLLYQKAFEEVFRILGLKLLEKM